MGLYLKINHKIGIPSTQKLEKYLDCSALEVKSVIINNSTMDIVIKRYSDGRKYPSKDIKAISKIPPSTFVLGMPYFWGQVDKWGSSSLRSRISKGRVATNTKR
jgi:hypothetical protein